MAVRILVVDDDPVMTRLATFVLESAGYQVLVANDGQRALDLLDREIPSLVLSDLAMPGIDGLELLQRIRDRADTADLPVVMLTARGEESAPRQAEAAGANGYLTKPVSRAEMLAEVERHLSPNTAAE